MTVLAPNKFRGKLIVVEGIDGSGKSTQISLLSQWLRSRGLAVAFSEWNSSPLVRETTRRGKKKEMFTPRTFSLIHATDFADRLERYITPLLKAGAIVCADRYAYTAFARDVVAAFQPRAGSAIFTGSPMRPNLRSISACRWTWPWAASWAAATPSSTTKPAWISGLSRNIEESFRLFQGRILEEYDAMAEEMGFHVIDATGSIEAAAAPDAAKSCWPRLGESLKTHRPAEPGI
jgi:dTMP kinase